VRNSVEVSLILMASLDTHSSQHNSVNANLRSDIMALTLKETLQTGAIVVGTYFGVLAITKMMTPDKNISEVAEKSESVAKEAEGLGCGCSNMDCNCAESDYSQPDTLPWDEMRIPHAQMVARNMTVRERSNTQMLELFGGVPPVTVTDMSSLITGGIL